MHAVMAVKEGVHGSLQCTGTVAMSVERYRRAHTYANVRAIQGLGIAQSRRARTALTFGKRAVNVIIDGFIN